MDLNVLLKLLTLAIPAGFDLIHILRDPATGQTTVMFFQNAKTANADVQGMVGTWFASHPAQGPAPAAAVQPGQTPKT